MFALCLEIIELAKWLKILNPTMLESYFLESFVGGLEPAIKSFVQAFNSQNLYDVVEIVRL